MVMDMDMEWKAYFCCEMRYLRVLFCGRTEYGQQCVACVMWQDNKLITCCQRLGPKNFCNEFDLRSGSLSLPTFPSLCLLVGLLDCQLTDMRLCRALCLSHLISSQLSGRTVSNNIFIDTIFGDCMPRITCHKPGAGGELLQQLPCGGRLQDVLAPTAYRGRCSGRHLSDLASESCGRVAVVAQRI